MSHLILIRHGQSEWNLKNRFTGWVDVELSAQGKLEACKAGELIKEQKLKFDYFYTSYQKRAIETLKLITTTLRVKDVETTKAWQLNERHYGALTGLNKDEMKKKIGEKKVHEFRRSWDIKPEALNKESSYHPLNIETYKKNDGHHRFPWVLAAHRSPNFLIIIFCHFFHITSLVCSA